MRAGDLVADRFEITGLAGAGGMGSVYRARDRRGGRWVALKVLETSDDIDGDRFAREADALSRVRDPAIVAYVAHGAVPSGERYLAMEWVEGQNLASRLADGALPIDEAVALARRVASALRAIHALGIVHRDVKPANLLLPGGDPGGAKLVDFGIARVSWMTSATRTGAMLGTPGYMSPEQVLGEDVDASADVFALGSVLYRCLTGRPCFGGDHPTAVLARVVLEEPVPLRALEPRVSPALEALVLSMLAKTRAGRPADGAAVLAALGEIGEGSLARPSAAPAIGDEERRLHTVILAGMGGPADELPTLRDLRTAEGAPPVDRLDSFVASIGGRIERLAAGPIVVTLSGQGEATDQAARAARGALGLRAILGGRPLAVATGSGTAAGRFTIGEVIDRAVSLLGPAERVRIDALTANLLGARFGIVREGDVLELGAERTESPSVRALLGRETPFVGRDRDLALLTRLMDECAARPIARAVLVTGEAGVGKSRLLHEVSRAVADRAEVLRGRGDATRAGAPFAVLSPAIRLACHVADDDSPVAAREKIAARASSMLGGADGERVGIFLAEIAGVPFPADTSLPLRAARADAVLMGDQTRRAVEDFLDAVTRKGPVLFLVEDLHWGDAPTVRALDSALRILRDRPLFVVAAARPEVEERFPKLWSDRGISRIRLGPLGRRASETIAKRVLGEGDPDRVARLVARAEGNALFLEELVRAEAEGAGAAPGAVLAMLRARLEALPTGARRTLRAASIFGRRFRAAGVAALAGADVRTVADTLADLGHREIVVGAGESWTFRHDLLREAAYATLTDADCVLGHRLAAEWLAASGERDALVLAEHFERGDDRRSAAEWFFAATRQALEGNDFEGAVLRADRGIACGASGERRAMLRGLQAEALKWIGRLTLALDAAGDAMAHLPAGSREWCAVAIERSIVAGNLGRIDVLAAVGDSLQGVGADAVGDPWIAAAASAMTSLSIAGLAEDAARLEARLALARPSAPETQARLDRARATRALEAGDAAAYLDSIGRALAVYEATGDRRGVAAMSVGIAHAWIELGDAAAAEQILRPSLETAERLGLMGVVASAQKNLGMAFMRLGRRDESIATLQEAARSAVRAGAPSVESGSRALLAWVLTDAGDLDGADAEVLQAIQLAAAPAARAFARGVQARAFLARGSVAEASEAAAEAGEILDALGSIYDGEAMVRLVRAEALEASGDAAGARAAIRAAADRIGARAAKVPPERHAAFVAIPEVARTLALAE